MTFRTWLSLITVVLLAAIVYFAREDIAEAWRLVGTVNLGVLLLLFPIQFFSYFVSAEMIFSYLRQKGMTKNVSPLSQARIALEMNFVNHTLPSGGVSGLSYTSWRLKKYGITPSRSTVAQLVRFVATFTSFATLLLLSIVVIAIDGSIDRMVILFASLITIAIISFVFLIVVVASSRRRSQMVARLVIHYGNRAIKLFSFGRSRRRISPSIIYDYFVDMHNEYLKLRRDPKILIKPYLWGLLFNALDVLMFVVAFLAFGEFVNPAIVLIAYGLAATASVLVVTPGGTGVFEAIMVSFIASAGTPGSLVIAAVILTRVILLAGTIGVGYVFYQHALVKYGKRKRPM